MVRNITMRACICRLAMVGLFSLLWLFSIASPASGQENASPPNATPPDATGQQAQAEPDPTPPPAPLVTFDQIKELQKRLDDSADLDDTARAAIKSKLDEATIQLRAFEDQQSKANGYQLTIDTAEERFKEATTLSQQPSADPKEGIPPVSSFGSELDKALADIEQRLVKLSGELIEAEAAAKANDPAERNARVLAIPAEQTRVTTKINELNPQVEIAIKDAGNSLAAAAEACRLQAELLANKARLDALRKEELSYTATVRLLPLKQKATAAQVELIKQKISILDGQKAEVQKLQRAKLRYRVELAARAAPNELKSQAVENLSLLKQFEKLSDYSKDVNSKLSYLDASLKDVQKREETTTDRVNAVGLTDALALLLQREKAVVQTLRAANQPDPTIREQIRLLQVKTFELEDEPISNSVPANETVTAEYLASLRIELLGEIRGVTSTLFLRLVSLDTKQRQLSELVIRYLDFIEENLLWTRNAPFLFANQGDPQHSEELKATGLLDPLGHSEEEPENAAAPLVTGLRWLISPQNWLATFRTFPVAFRDTPIMVILVVFLLVVLVLGRERGREILKKQAAIARRRNCTKIEPTLRATFATLMLAAPMPIFFTAIGYILTRNDSGNEFIYCLGQGFRYVAIFLIPFELFRHVCRAEGLGIDHFDWRDAVCKKIRHGCRDVATLGCPMTVVIVMLHLQSDDSISDTLGRYIIIGLMLVFLVEVHQLLRPSRLWEHATSKTLFFRYRRAIYVVCLCAPVSVILLISFGYEYMTVSVINHLLTTAIAIMVIVLVEAIALRALLVRRRRITIDQIRQQATSSESGTDDGGFELIEKETDLVSVSQQAQQLVRLVAFLTCVGSLSLIWADLLPALTMLNRVEVWPSASGAVTLRDILFAGLIIGLTLYAVKSLPALAEMFLLQRFEPGARYAITTIFRYVVGTFGVVFGLNFLSIPWSQLSWIVAAASVGLGFGLQEILANFVSGIILLLEQPIRVGDIVTVDGTTGVVTRMQIRATTLTNYDRQELLIPNKDLITGKLLNWTLTSVVNRLVINVGVAYGSDADEVREVLLGVIQAHPEVMDDPAPNVTFEQFGDSSLNFVIRCYLPNLDKRLSVTHDLHAEIAKALDAAKIDIPFPQRDIRMTIEPSASELAGTSPPPAGN